MDIIIRMIKPTRLVTLTAIHKCVLTIFSSILVELIELYFFFDTNLFAFILIPLLQQEQDIFINAIWNSHRIRKQAETTLPDSILNHIHAFPEEVMYISRFAGE